MNGDDNLAKNVDAVVWIENEAIHVAGPSAGGRPALVSPGENVELFVDGRRVTSEVEVTQASSVFVKLPSEEPQVLLSLKVDASAMEAVVQVERRDGFRARLLPHPKTSRLEIRFEKETVPARISMPEVLEFLRTKGIVEGIDEEGCRRLVDGENQAVVARGVPPTPGQDGKITFLVDLQRTVVLSQDALRVDFRDWVKVPDVRAGDTIAVKSPPIPGKAGKTVYGKPVLPAKPVDPPLKPGKNVSLEEKDGLIFFKAASSGCPKFDEKSGLLEVDNVYRHKGDVNLQTGNVRVSGNAEISGNVTEGMLVEAEGSVEVLGTVSEASLVSFGSIRVAGSAFKSRIVAGKDVAKLQTLDDLVSKALDAASLVLDLEQDRAILEALAGDSGGEKDSIWRRLAEITLDRFRQLVICLSPLIGFDFSSLPEELRDMSDKLKQAILVGGSPLDRARTVRERLMPLRTYLDLELIKGQSDVFLTYVQNSHVFASRDILISGQGAFYCQLIAGKSVKVKGSPGVIRGGKVLAGELVEAGVIGGQGAAVTEVRVSAKGTIRALTVHPNTVIAVGKVKVRTENELKDVNVFVRDGKVQIQSQSGTLVVDR